MEPRTEKSHVIARLGALEPASGSVAVSWLGQASVALRLGRTTVLVDPFLSPHPDRLIAPPLVPESATDVELVLVTHDHLDHLDPDALPRIADASLGASLIIPHELVDRVHALGIARERLLALGPAERLEHRGLIIHGVPACHGVEMADAYRLGPFLGYVIEGSGVRVYHAGDTIPFPGLVEHLCEIGVDLALLPINGRDSRREALGIVGNLDGCEAAELALAIQADAVVPLHWDMFAANLGDPAELVRYAQTTVVVPRRLEPFVYTVPASRRLGVQSRS